MLSCRDLTVSAPDSGEPILKNATLSFLPKAMNAVIGPSGCGKTTLVKAMLKILPSSGASYFNGMEITRSENLVGRVGFAPQFTCVHPMSTVREALRDAMNISVDKSLQKPGTIDRILKTVGLTEHGGKLVKSLSGGQLRRMGLAVELVSDPALLCCDEVTTGLDPLSENSILDLMKDLCRKNGKTFVCVIHNLAKLDYFDNITVVYKAEIVFHGTLPELLTHFEIDTPLEVYDALSSRGMDYWRRKREAEQSEVPGASGGNAGYPPVQSASAASQFATLLLRRYRIFFRDGGYFALTLAITFGFPLIVVIFSIGGLPQMASLSMDRNMSVFDELRASLEIQAETAGISALITGLVLFQVMLLALMGANNSACEISGERALYEKERLIGLRPSMYALSKIVFTLSLAVFQGMWMCAFVKYSCIFPGSYASQGVVLAMLCAAMTATCLAFSALMDSPEKSNLVSVYLVGFQLPLSGVVLALPEALKWVCRPFISTYWGWAGYMGSMRDTRIYDAYMQTSSPWEFIPSPGLSVAVLLLQTAVALGFVFFGCRQKKWNRL